MPIPLFQKNSLSRHLNHLHRSYDYAVSLAQKISCLVTARLQMLQHLGSLYTCDYKNTKSLNPSTLFSTIAQHLADHDSLCKHCLLTTMKDDIAICTMKICRQQYQHFIITPSFDLPVVGETVIMIDVFDKIGSVEDQAEALNILSPQTLCQPACHGDFLLQAGYSKSSPIHKSCKCRLHASTLNICSMTCYCTVSTTKFLMHNEACIVKYHKHGWYEIAWKGS